MTAAYVCQAGHIFDSLPEYRFATMHSMSSAQKACPTASICIQATVDINAELDCQQVCNRVSQSVCCLQVQGSDRTTIRAVKPKSEQADAQGSANAWPLVAEQSFAREFYHVVLNAGKACCAKCKTCTSTWFARVVLNILHGVACIQCASPWSVNVFLQVVEHPFACNTDTNSCATHLLSFSKSLVLPSHHYCGCHHCHYYCCCRCCQFLVVVYPWHQVLAWVC